MGAGADNTGPLFIDWTSPSSPGVPFSASDGNRWNGNDKVFTVGWGVSVLWYDTSLVGDNAWHDCRFNTVQWNAASDADKLSLDLDVGGSGIATDFTVPTTGRYFIGGMQRGAVPTGSSAGYWQFQVLIDTGSRQVPIDRDIAAYTPGVQQTLRLGKVHDLNAGMVLRFQHFSSGTGMVLDFDDPRPHAQIEYLHRSLA